MNTPHTPKLEPMQEVFDCLNEALNLIVRAKKLDEMVSHETMREMGSTHPSITKSATPHLWVLDQYDTDLTAFEDRAKKAITAYNTRSAAPGQSAPPQENIEGADIDLVLDFVDRITDRGRLHPEMYKASEKIRATLQRGRKG